MRKNQGIRNIVKLDLSDYDPNDPDALDYQLIVYSILSSYDTARVLTLKNLITTSNLVKQPEVFNALTSFFLGMVSTKSSYKEIQSLPKEILKPLFQQIQNGNKIPITLDEFHERLLAKLSQPLDLLEYIKEKISAPNDDDQEMASATTIHVKAGGELALTFPPALKVKKRTGLLTKLNTAWDDTFDVPENFFLESAWSQARLYLGMPRDDHNGNYIVKWIAYGLGGFIITPIINILRLPFEMLPYGIECALRHWQERTNSPLASALLTGAIGVMSGFRLIVRAAVSPIKSIRRALALKNPWLSTGAVVLSILISAAAITALAVFAAPALTAKVGPVAITHAGHMLAHGATIWAAIKVAFTSLPTLITLAAVGIQAAAVPLQKIIPSKKIALLLDTSPEPKADEDTISIAPKRKFWVGKTATKRFHVGHPTITRARSRKIDFGLDSLDEAQRKQHMSSVVTGTPSVSKSNSLERETHITPKTVTQTAFGENKLHHPQTATRKKQKHRPQLRPGSDGFGSDT